MLCNKRCNDVLDMDSSAEARRVDFFELLTNVKATNVLFSSVVEVLGRPHFGALFNEPALSNLFLKL